MYSPSMLKATKFRNQKRSKYMERQCSWIEIINVVKSNVIYQFNRIPNTILTFPFADRDKIVLIFILKGKCAIIAEWIMERRIKNYYPISRLT